MSKSEKDIPKKTAAQQAGTPFTPIDAALHAIGVAGRPASAEPQDELSSLRSKLTEYEGDLQRLVAEFDNYKKRVDKEKTQARQLGKAEALSPFLDMNEVFEKALTHNGKADAKVMHEGLVLLHKQLQSIFVTNGVKEIKCSGLPHHAYHDVMLQVPGEPAGEIAQVLRKGYVMGEYVLRPAQVSVHAEKKEEKEENEMKEKEAEGNADEENANGAAATEEDSKGNPEKNE